MKLLLLLCLGLTLVCAHQGGSHDIVTSNIDISKMSGEWYSILLSSDVMETIEENGRLRMFLKYMEPLENSSVLLVYQLKENEECTEVNFIFDETEEKDVYEVTYDGYNTSQIYEAVYNEYFIFYALNFNNGKKTLRIGLNARKPDVSPQLRRRLEEVCQKHGIPKENILDLTKADRCLHARGTHGDQASRCCKNEPGVLRLSLSWCYESMGHVGRALPENLGFTVASPHTLCW